LEGCGRRIPEPWINDVLLLYQDCKSRNALPRSGGIMDQDADIIRWFRVIDDKIAKRKQEADDREKLKWQMSKRT
jgi:hypothetical protein